MAVRIAVTKRIFLVVTWLTLLETAALGTVTMERRPFFVIGHMVNSLYDVDVFLESGSNALEADIQFGPTGTPTWVHHGVPCDCFRVCTRYAAVPEYLDYLRSVASVDGGKFKGNVAFLFLDLKTSKIDPGYKYRAGEAISTYVIKHLWRNVSPMNALNVLFYVESLDDGRVFNGILDTLSALSDSEHWKNRAGFDFGGTDSLEDVGRAFADLNISDHRWVGSGNCNCLPYMHEIYARLEDTVACRDGLKSGCAFVDKGYAWTLDYESSIAREIKLGLDGVITNYPANALAALKRDDVARIAQLAGPKDSPWTRVKTTT